MQSDDDGELTFVETTPADDVIEGRSPRPPARWAVRPWWIAVLVVGVLAAGIGIGYALGRHSSTPATAPETSLPAGSVLSELPRLNTTGSICSVQPAGTRRLLLGIQVENGGPAPIQVSEVQGSFPMGGLRVVDAAVGHCYDPGVPVLGNWVAAGGTTWLRLTVDVLVGCPKPLPVEFQVEYTVDGAPNGVSFLAFPDLGTVTYSGC